MTIRECMNFGGVVLTAAALVSITAGAAGAQDKCAAAEMTALAKAFSGATSCAKKSVKNGQVDTAKACMDAQQAKYDAAVAKAEAKGNCRSLGLPTLPYLLKRLVGFTDVIDALTPGGAGGTCASAKLAAAGTLAADESKCEASAFRTLYNFAGAEIKRTACYAKARTKYDAAVAKRESKGGCPTTGDGGTIATKITSTVAGAVTLIVPPSPGCKGQCLSNGAYSELLDPATCPNPVSFRPDSIVSLTMCAFGKGDPACGFGFCETSVTPPAYCSNGVAPDCLGVCFLPESPISQVVCGGALQPGCGVGTCMDIGNGTLSYCNDCVCYIPGGSVSLFFCGGSTVAFSEIQTIFTQRCVSCHNSTTPAADLDLSTGNAYGQLVNVESVFELPPVLRVAPYDLVNSRLLSLVRTGFMPPSGGGGPLTAAQIELIRAWIVQGAKP